MSHAAHGPNWPARIGLALLSLLALTLSVALAVTIGEMAIPFQVAVKALGNGLFDLDLPVSAIQQGVIFDYRLSRALMAGLCGGALALSGAILQALLRNPLAEPYILGISAGASTGAVAVLILGIGIGGVAISLSTGAFIGACAALAVVALLATGAGGASDRVILAGVATSQLFNAATATIVTTLASAEQARGVMFWLLGNFGGVRWPDLWIATPVALLGFGVCMLHAKALDAFAFGVDAAASLGIAVSARADRAVRDDGGDDRRHGQHRRHGRLRRPRHPARRAFPRRLGPCPPAAGLPRDRRGLHDPRRHPLARVGTAADPADRRRHRPVRGAGLRADPLSRQETCVRKPA